MFRPEPKVVDSSCSCSGPEEDIESHNSQFANIYPIHLYNLSDRYKVAALVQTFPGIRPSELKRTLNKCKGRATLAIDVLLNQIFLGESRIKSQGPKGVTKSKLSPHPPNDTGSKPSVAVAGRGKKSHNTTRRFRSKGKVKFSHDGRYHAQFDCAKSAHKSFIKKPLVKPSTDRVKGSARDVRNVPNVPAAGKREDRGEDNGKARSMQQSKGKNGGEGDGRGIRGASKTSQQQSRDIEI